MISLKKSYARQLLQLALTLSLLRVDPEHYLGWGWESQLALQNGDGWQLELRGAPITNHSYSNRKALIPLIEDLVRFDRQRDITSSYDVQTYLLNVQNEQITAMSSSPPAPPTNQPETNATAAIIAPIAAQAQNTTDFTVPLGMDLGDFFLHADAFAESASVFDQNLADLNDYEGLSDPIDDPFANFQSLYAGLPLKDEPSEILGNDRLVNPRLNEAEQTASTSSGDFGSNPSDPNDNYGFLRESDSPRLNYSRIIEWSTYFRDETDDNETAEQSNDETSDVTVKTEPEDKEVSAGEGTSTSRGRRHDSGIKLESESEEDSDGRSSHSDCKNSTSGFGSNVELTEEVSYITSFIKSATIHKTRGKHTVTNS